MIFKKVAKRTNLNFTNDGTDFEIVHMFPYLGIVFFSTWGSFFNFQTNDALTGQALKAIFKLKLYMQKFTELHYFRYTSHPNSKFTDLESGILLKKLKNIHVHFCKSLLGVRLPTQNSFIYHDLSTMTLRNTCLTKITNYWFKIIKKMIVKKLKKFILWC
jgi:hypothetical protein